MKTKKTVIREITVQRTPIFHQICGKFDLPNDATSVVTWDADITLPAEWNVGVITGPSMAGKSTLANELFPGELIEQGFWQWPPDKCIGDGFPEGTSIDEITGLLSSVGFSSPPDWKKPYCALSNGGKFRVDLARTLAERPQRAVIDEFGSLTHAKARTVAAAASAKAVRRRAGQLVAVCVHEDCVEYFEPDWIIRITPGEPVRLEETRGSVRRPPIELRIERTTKETWALFRHHHYLNHELHRAAKCFVGYVDGEPAAFTAVISFPHPVKPAWREHRTVCLPDFQGIGVGNRMSEFVASLFRGTGKPYLSTTSHPAMMRHRARSPLWRMIRKPSLAGVHRGRGTGMKATGSGSRITAGFEYVGPANDQEARRFGILKADSASA
jgi:GNAT superfamily N-acetyltransferase